jgi:hypothetical protein
VVSAGLAGEGGNCGGANRLVLVAGDERYEKPGAIRRECEDGDRPSACRYRQLDGLSERHQRIGHQGSLPGGRIDGRTLAARPAAGHSGEECQARLGLRTAERRHRRPQRQPFFCLARRDLGQLAKLFQELQLLGLERRLRRFEVGGQ